LFDQTADFMIVVHRHTEPFELPHGVQEILDIAPAPAAAVVDHIRGGVRIKTPGILQGPKTEQKVIDELRGTMEKGVAFHGKTINYRKNGSEFMIEWKVFPVRDREGSIGTQRLFP